MSHIVGIKTEIKDIAALKEACKELGLVFKENQHVVRYFENSWNSDLDLNADGEFAHAISHHTSEYDIGVRKTSTGYSLEWDHFSKNGGRLDAVVGSKGERLLQLYGVHKATLEARKKGWTVQRKQVNQKGEIQLVVTAY